MKIKTVRKKWHKGLLVPDYKRKLTLADRRNLNRIILLMKVLNRKIIAYDTYMIKLIKSKEKE